ncbi:helix-turn-helix domain-containing protein [uncultured Azonexus sp.]|uniref:helix-turn-helix transcriptional regulator n=1 Tax=uncultured Azonexus sp. TaxID=520307 RepID=UPI0034580A7B
MNTPQKLVTKELAAELLSVSMRTINYWISDGTLPMPTAIGRRVYWHPVEFRAWQDRLFGLKEESQNQTIAPTKRNRGRPRNQMH